MDISRIIENIEKLFYNLLILIVLVPKTVFYLLIPNWSPTYVEDQFNLPEEERFKDNVSPIILFMMFVTFPIFYSLSYGTSLAPLDTVREDPFSLITTNESLTIIDKFLIISIIFNTYPVVFSLFSIVYRKEQLNKETFKIIYYQFLYTFCVIYITFIFLFSTVFISPDHYFRDYILFLFSLMLFIYAIVTSTITNTTILKKLLGVNPVKALLIVFFIYLISFIVNMYLVYNILSVILKNFID